MRGLCSVLVLLLCGPAALGAKKAPARPVGAGEIQSLRRAIEDLTATFGSKYLRGREYLKRVNKMAKAMGRDKARVAAFEKLRREALVANPLVSGQPIVFVVRRQYARSTHDSLQQIGTGRNGEYRPGSALKVVDLATGRVRTLLDVPKGIVRDPCVHFDGRRIAFALRRTINENYHLFEIGADGKGLRQLTSAPDVSDADPVYLPGGGIVFSSTREYKRVPCAHDIVPNLFRMDADGANIHQITRNSAHENQCSLMPDGRIMYSRWDYVDRNFGDGHGFWVANPDGSNQAILWGNNTAHPSSGWSGRIIPGSQQIVCILGTHHGIAWGSLALIDPAKAIDGKASIVRTWPAGVIKQFDDKDHFRFDTLKGVWPKYDTPYPLSDPSTGLGAGKYFLCSRTLSTKPAKGKKQEKTGIYLVDVFGNELLLHAEGPGCFSPKPLAPRRRPAVLAARRDYGTGDGFFFVQNVYVGTHMKGVKPGAAKYLRVVEAINKHGLSAKDWRGQGAHFPGVNWDDFLPKRILGTVPVAPDGSAYFAVPSDRFVYFQLLDENRMMIQSMRSGTMIHSGETQSCVGCHESRLEGPRGPSKAGSLARSQRPSKLEPWYGPSRAFNYLAEVQPVLDRNCVKCHDFGKKGAAKLILAGDKNPFFNVSYMDLWRKKYVGAIGAGRASHQPAYGWGSHTSKLIAVLRKGHKDLKLSREDLDRLITWVDINGPYYPTTYAARPHGRAALDRKQLGKLEKLTGRKLVGQATNTSYRGPMISFDRPKLSPCLAKLKPGSVAYANALAIIRAGSQSLTDNPRADMPGFVPRDEDRQRQAHLVKYRNIELRVREAIRHGRKLYDADFANQPELATGRKSPAPAKTNKRP